MVSVSPKFGLLTAIPLTKQRTVPHAQCFTLKNTGADLGYTGTICPPQLPQIFPVSLCQRLFVSVFTQIPLSEHSSTHYISCFTVPLQKKPNPIMKLPACWSSTNHALSRILYRDGWKTTQLVDCSHPQHCNNNCSMFAPTPAQTSAWISASVCLTKT